MKRKIIGPYLVSNLENPTVGAMSPTFLASPSTSTLATEDFPAPSRPSTSRQRRRSRAPMRPVPRRRQQQQHKDIVKSLFNFVFHKTNSLFPLSFLPLPPTPLLLQTLQQLDLLPDLLWLPVVPLRDVSALLSHRHQRILVIPPPGDPALQPRQLKVQPEGAAVQQEVVA